MIHTWTHHGAIGKIVGGKGGCWRGKGHPPGVWISARYYVARHRPQGEARAKATKAKADAAMQARKEGKKMLERRRRRAQRSAAERARKKEARKMEAAAVEEKGEVGDQEEEEEEDEAGEAAPTPLLARRLECGYIFEEGRHCHQ
jgi:ATPase subunit of ABC transporter with duplicated ATPase domains